VAKTKELKKAASMGGIEEEGEEFIIHVRFGKELVPRERLFLFQRMTLDLRRATSPQLQRRPMRQTLASPQRHPPTTMLSRERLFLFQRVRDRAKVRVRVRVLSPRPLTPQPTAPQTSIYGRGEGRASIHVRCTLCRRAEARTWSTASSSAPASPLACPRPSAPPRRPATPYAHRLRQRLPS